MFSHVFICRLCIFGEECSQVFCTFLNWDVFFLTVEFMNLSYYEYKSVVGFVLCSIFSQSAVYLFV